jgi:cystathionine beta-lyase/cystathionine gamma-synthase
MRGGEAERENLGIADGIIRLSVRLKDAEDIKDYLARALTAAQQVHAA